MQRLASYQRQEAEAAALAQTSRETYRLFQATMGFWHSRRHPDRVLCVELRRDLLAEDFRPFEAMTISPEKAESFAAPLARALARGRT